MFARKDLVELIGFSLATVIGAGLFSYLFLTVMARL